MQITLQENQDGIYCLFDTRSGQFLKGGCVRSKESGLLEIANNIARKSFKSIVEIADNYNYQEGDGYASAMFCRSYLAVNQDIRQKVKERLALKEDKKTQTKRKPKAEKPVKVKKEKPAKVPTAPKEKVVIGLNEDGTPMYRKRGRPKSSTPKPEKIVSVDANGQRRKRGRPPKNQVSASF
jgi:hypothetical protein